MNVTDGVSGGTCSSDPVLFSCTVLISPSTSTQGLYEHVNLSASAVAFYPFHITVFLFVFFIIVLNCLPLEMLDCLHCTTFISMICTSILRLCGCFQLHHWLFPLYSDGV